ncbi:MAG: type II toxin-antitoxin system VapC family toxin [Chloroflexi bacterium]|nr:type II toxin-antitoxin system VapC family toxin [Chloroflexota bacterium]
MRPGAFVLDASVALAWAFRNEDNPYVARVLRSLKMAWAWVPTIWPLEVANGLLVAERRQRLQPGEAEDFLQYLAHLPIEVIYGPETTVGQEILPLARETGLSVYDASYLHLALQRGVPLATQDRRLRQAAQARGIWFDPTSSPA